MSLGRGVAAAFRGHLGLRAIVPVSPARTRAVGCRKQVRGTPSRKWDLGPVLAWLVPLALLAALCLVTPVGRHLAVSLWHDAESVTRFGGY